MNITVDSFFHIITCNTKLTELNLHSLKICRLRGDMIEVSDGLKSLTGQAWIEY